MEMGTMLGTFESSSVQQQYDAAELMLNEIPCENHLFVS